MSSPNPTEVQCQESPYCTDDKCHCEEWQIQKDTQDLLVENQEAQLKALGSIAEFHEKQMEALQDIIRNTNK